MNQQLLYLCIITCWCFTGKMPKNTDAELDPERWLPRKERSYYRGKRRDKRKDIGKVIQTDSNQ